MAKKLVILVFLSSVLNFTEIVSELVPMRVINELPNAGYSNLQKVESKPRERLPLRMKPANFSGPEHLQELAGRCFKHRDLKYEYVLCPFHNITQEDIQAYYEPYRGVLGVWSDWVIEDNKFAMMNMIEGSSCGEGGHRSTKVAFSCGASSELLSVTEPEKCRYLAVFETPEVCGKNAMVVYPRLPEDLRRRWDEAEQERHDGFLTEKGYQKELKSIFLAAGLHLSADDRLTLLQKASADSPNDCKTSLEAAQSRITKLEEELRMKDEIIRELGENKREL